MLRDMVTVNELTNWNIKEASIEAKYRALKCHIETITNNTHEYAKISNMISSSTNPNELVIIHHIYSIAKQTDILNFRSTLFNQKQLFHGSKYINFLVVDDLEIERTDIGCLGYGLYFSDSASTSLKYTTPSITRPGRRLLCICQVALGNSAKFYSYAPNLIQPSENFHSSHGDDEYVNYNLDQQRLLYIVELSWLPHDKMGQSPILLPIIRDPLINQSKSLSNEVYHNTSLIPIEAKYIFPFDENSSVCDFEAHINNKIIKGIIKEKEQTKREYHEAIEQGHDA
ncbi:unnamed protein product [Rotaria sp. Silwood1]|nr:unnamed protein product [Rotaria sp. Silwood1]